MGSMKVYLFLSFYSVQFVCLGDDGLVGGTSTRTSVSPEGPRRPFPGGRPNVDRCEVGEVYTSLRHVVGSPVGLGPRRRRVPVEERRHETPLVGRQPPLEVPTSSRGRPSVPPRPNRKLLFSRGPRRFRGRCRRCHVSVVRRPRVTVSPERVAVEGPPEVVDGGEVTLGEPFIRLVFFLTPTCGGLPRLRRSLGPLTDTAGTPRPRGEYETPVTVTTTVTQARQPPVRPVRLVDPGTWSRASYLQPLKWGVSPVRQSCVDRRFR